MADKMKINMKVVMRTTRMMSIVRVVKSIIIITIMMNTSGLETPGK